MIKPQKRGRKRGSKKQDRNFNRPKVSQGRGSHYRGIFQSLIARPTEKTKNPRRSARSFKSLELSHQRVPRIPSSPISQIEKAQSHGSNDELKRLKSGQFRGSSLDLRLSVEPKRKQVSSKKHSIEEKDENVRVCG